MTEKKFTLNDLEIACGVTLEDVQHYLPRGVFRDNDRVFVVDEDVTPAVGLATARCAFGIDHSPEYVGKTPLGRAYART